ncbi:NTP pyrophosphohydrolase [Brachybacterium endophyticum]|uniref:NTP pyrophosphohydrolase n=2 Tax=Brachybacterium endophyticum TaxID=2182385 RepID=A0A2U2RMG4_9MICO|nr:NTP pyrophosphohydrolase [Brachybacterium endophyticum]
MAAEGGGLHVTASAVVLDGAAEQLALVWHGKAHCWVQPGGHLEAEDASLEEAARREVAEETGLQDLSLVGPGPALLEVHDLASTFGTCGGHWDVVFVLRAEGDAADVTLHPESPDGPAPIWVPWPRTETPGSLDDSGLPATGFSPQVPLPENAASDMAEILARLAPYLDEFAAPTRTAKHRGLSEADGNG